MSAVKEQHSGGTGAESTLLRFLIGVARNRSVWKGHKRVSRLNFLKANGITDRRDPDHSKSQSGDPKLGCAG